MRDLIERLENAEAGSAELDVEIELALIIHPRNREYAKRIGIAAPDYTTSITDATWLVSELLSGWAWKVGTCCVSDDAWIAPDFNHHIHGPRLKEQFFPIDAGGIWDAGVDIDLRPSGRPAIALCIALLTVLEALEVRK